MVLEFLCLSRCCSAMGIPFGHRDRPTPRRRLTSLIVALRTSFLVR
jgi:hypothetical protein